MNIKDVQKRIDKAIKKHRAKALKQLKKYQAELKRYPKRDYLKNWILSEERKATKGLPWSYRINRQGVYGNSRGTFAIDLEREVGHSYRWWSMFERIKGHLVLNSYRYSHQTSLHISHSADVLKSLGIKFIEIEAPQGLQDLDSAVFNAAYQWGKATVAQKYARKKYKGALNHAKGLIKNLSKIGLKVPKKLLVEAVAKAEVARTKKNERIREKSAIRRQRAFKLQVLASSTCDKCNATVTESCKECFGIICASCHSSYSLKRSNTGHAEAPLTNDDVRDNAANVYHLERSSK